MKSVYLANALLKSSVYFLESQPIAVQQRLMRLLTNSSNTPTREQQRMALSQVFLLLQEDSALLDQIGYPLNWISPGEAVHHVKTYVNVLKDGLSILWRRLNKNNKAFSEEVKDQLKDLPLYYRRNFHFQTDGYLSEHSAELYDHQVEILFLGAADAMRRMVLSPLLKLEFESKKQKIKLLEFGSGTGVATRHVALAFPHVDIVGVDLSPAYTQKAKQNLRDYENVKFMTAPAEKLNFKDGSFDAVYSVFMFHELPKEVREQVIQEAFRVLKPGGRLVIVDSIQDGDSPEMAWATDLFPRDFHEPFYKGYLKHPLEKIMTTNGFVNPQTHVRFVSKAVWADKPR